MRTADSGARSPRMGSSNLTPSNPRNVRPTAVVDSLPLDPVEVLGDHPGQFLEDQRDRPAHRTDMHGDPMPIKNQDLSIKNPAHGSRGSYGSRYPSRIPLMSKPQNWIRCYILAHGVPRVQPKSPGGGEGGASHEFAGWFEFQATFRSYCQSLAHSSLKIDRRRAST